MNWPAIIGALKNLTTMRFYFIVTLIFLLLVGSMYKETISVAVEEVTFSRIEFRECRDLKGLEVALININSKYPLIKTFTVYIYQPKDRSYYKKVILTNDDIVKSTLALQGSYIENQTSINMAFEKQDYLLINEYTNYSDMKFIKDLGINHLLVYKLHAKTNIGEIYLNLTRNPTPEELEALIKVISPLVHIYII